MFTSNASYWLDTHRELLRDDTNLKRAFYRPAHTRMEREGWVGNDPARKWRSTVFEKEIPKGWTLRLEENYPKLRYELAHRERRIRLEFPSWEWADWDRNRLVWAEQGCLRAGTLEAHGPGSAKTLYDFNGMVSPNPQSPTPNSQV